MRQRNSILRDNADDANPLEMLTNLFDVAMVFAVGLMVALVARYNMSEIFSRDDFTIVKNPGTPEMEVITKQGEEIHRYSPSENADPSAGALGQRVGTAYRLPSGEVIYIPE